MNRLSLPLVALLALAAPLPATASAEPPVVPADAAPATLRFSPATIDMGEMIAGQQKTVTLTVTNASDAPVTIESMKGGCGCTTLGAFPKDPIAPGASFDVTVTMDPGKRTGIDLKKPVHVALAGGKVETMFIVATVKTVIRVSPEAVDAIEPLVGPAPTITLANVDGKPFTVTGVVPEGAVKLPADAKPAATFDLAFEMDAWVKAGRPATIVVTTDRADAKELTVPVKVAQAVSMFRLPAANEAADRDAAERVEVERIQDSLLREIDAKIDAPARSGQFRVRLHRESGMLFVYGTDEDLAAMRAAVRALPAERGVRESSTLPSG
jgi:hypothetical protein